MRSHEEPTSPGMRRMVSLSKILSPTARGKWTLRLLRSIDPENMRCNIKSGAESCKPFLSIGISKKFPLTESLILQSKSTLYTFHHHPVYQDKFSSIYRKIKCCDRKIGVALTKAERSLIRRRRCVSCVRVIKRIIKTQSLITRKQFLGSETMTFQVSNIGKVFSGISINSIYVRSIQCHLVL